MTVSYNLYPQQSFLIFGVDELGGDSIEGASAFLGDDPGVDSEGVSLLVFSDDFLLLELLEAPSDNFGAGVLVPGVSAGHSVLLAVHMRQKLNSGSRPEVDFPSQGCDSNINPIVVERGEFGGCIVSKGTSGGFHVVGPLGSFD